MDRPSSSCHVVARRRLALVLVALAAVAGCSDPESATGPPADALPGGGAAAAPGPVALQKPDVLVLVLDSLRVDRMSDLRRRETERVITPNLDGISHAGTTAYLGFAPSPHTAPSLMSLFTGLAPAAHGVRNADADGLWVLSENVTTLAQIMKSGGYTTVLVHETGQVQPEVGFDRGFDLVVPTGGLEGSLTSLDTLIANAPDDRPQFVVVHSYAAHAPFLPPRERFGVQYRGRYTEGADVDPERGGLFRERTEALENFEGNRRGRVYADLASNFLEPYDGMTADDVAWLNDLYDENVAWVDAVVGDLVDSWSRHRSYGDTIVALTASHGIALGENGQFGNESGLFGALTHVPLVIGGPGVAPGTIVTSLSTASMPATLLGLVGLDAPRAMAESIGPALLERGQSEFYGEVVMQSLATGEFGYSRLRFAVLLDEDGANPRFFDPYTEPALLTEAELEPVVAEALLNGHRASLAGDAARRTSNPPTRATLPPRSRQRLRVLGYLR